MIITFLAEKLAQEVPGESPPPGGGLEGQPIPPEIQNPALVRSLQRLTGAEFLNRFLPNLVGAFIIGAVIVDFFVLMIGGIKWASAGGSQEQLANAKGMIKNALIGLVIILSTFAILKLLGAIFGINLLVLDLSSLFLR